MIGLFRSVLAEVSKSSLSEQIAKLIEKLVECESVHNVVGTIGAAGATVLCPAIALVGMELLAIRKERKEEKAFEAHCNEVVKLLRHLEGHVEETAEHLGGIYDHKRWIWAKLSGADAAALARNVARQVEKTFVDFKLDTIDRLEGVETYLAETLRTLDIVHQNTEVIRDTTARIEANQLTKADLQAAVDGMLAKLQANAPAATRVDSSNRRDLAATVESVALDAVRGDAAARDALESQDPTALRAFLRNRASLLAEVHSRVDNKLIVTYRQLATVAFTTGELDEAEAAWLEILKLLPDDFDATRRLGWVYEVRGNLPLAKTFYERALDLAADNLSARSAALNNLGIIARIQGDPANALTLYQRSLDLALGAGDDERQSITLSNLGNLAQTRGDLDAAEKLHREALAINRKLGRLEGQASNLGNLGNLAQTRGDLDAAETLHREALAINRKLGWLEGQASNLGNLGNLAQTRGDLDAAETLHREALAINRKLGRLEGEAINFGNLGLIAQDRGDLDAAETLHREALAVNRKLGGLEGQASNLGNLGNLAQTRGDLYEAEKLYRESLEINCKLGWLAGQAINLANLGLIAQGRGDLDGAEKLLREALEIDRKLGRLEGQASNLANLGAVSKDRGNVAEARKLWIESRDLYARVGIPHMVKKVQGWIDGVPSEAE